MRQHILPKEQWTKYEEDKLYLGPQLKEVNLGKKRKRRMGKEIIMQLKSVDTAVLKVF